MGPQATEAYGKLIKLECRLSQCPRRRAGYAGLARRAAEAKAEFERLADAGL